MTDRVKKRLEATKVKKYPICTEAVEIMIPSYIRNDGKPHIVRRAQGAADYLDNRTIFILEDELLVGNIASKPMGMEASTEGPTWPDDDLDDLVHGNEVFMAPEAKEKLKMASEYWSGRGRTEAERRGVYYNDERIWPFIQSGFLCPAWKDKKEGRGTGHAGRGWGQTSGNIALYTPDYAYILKTGFEAKIAEVKKALSELRFTSNEAIETADYYMAAIIAMEAMIRTGDRFSKLAADMAEKESDEKRRAELLQIAEICQNVPRKPASNFKEAMQFFLFYFYYTMNGTLCGGRFDQTMYPYYKKDLEEGKITREEALELVELLRIKIFEFNSIGGGKAQRAKWAGMARWHNFMIGGYDENGKECSNEISFMMLDAAEETRTPHPTITLRVCEETPQALMKRALEVVRSGIGMPAFVSDKSNINFLVSRGVPLKHARNYAMAGCLDLQVTGMSRQNSVGMFVVPMIVQLAMNDGHNPNNGMFYGNETGKFNEFKSYEKFYAAFLKHLDWALGLICEEHNIQLNYWRTYVPDALTSVFMHEGVSSGKEMMNRRMVYENGALANMVGVVNAINSLAAVKKLVFDEKKISAEKLIEALNANWEGYEDIRKLCLEAPKFGNNDPYVDSIAARLWTDFAGLCKHHYTIFGESMVPAGISITAYAPGGNSMGPTPDGRVSGETLADGSISPMQGSDINGPVAVLQSGMAINQDEFMSTLLNMKFSPSTLKTDSDLEKLGTLIKTYLTNGGKHIQFNVISKKTLLDAQVNRDDYRDLIVRVAGYSAYFVALTKSVQEDVISRTSHDI